MSIFNSQKRHYNNNSQNSTFRQKSTANNQGANKLSQREQQIQQLQESMSNSKSTNTKPTDVNKKALPNLKVKYRNQAQRDTYSSTYSQNFINHNQSKAIKSRELDYYYEPAKKSCLIEESKFYELQSSQPECAICYSQILQKDSFQTTNICKHSFHRNCIKEYLLHQISESNFPIQCPTYKCYQIIPNSKIRDLLNEKEYEKYYRFSFKSFIASNKKDIFACPKPDCNYYSFKENEPADYHFCPECKLKFCKKCNLEFHVGKTCGEARHRFDAYDNAKFIEYVSKNKVQQCPSCGRWIEKRGGCSSLTCKCGTIFCFCGELATECLCSAYDHIGGSC